jgi:cytokinin dehydrogenase
MFSQDNGRYLTREPLSVVRPGSVRDIEAAIQHCRRLGITVTPRGRANSTHGQALTTGLVIDTGTLAEIRINEDTADVGAGATWLEVTRAAFRRGLMPPVLTGYLGLTVGGTLSMGGTSTTVRAGTLVDHVRELEVVTGAGETVCCSPTDNPQLFNAVLAGLGQYGVITRATIDLVPAMPMVRDYQIPYADNETLFADLRILLDRGELSDIWAQWFPAPFLMAAQPFDPANPPDDADLLRGLHSSPADVKDRPFLEFAERIDDFIEELRATIDWDNLVKPWLNVWLPESTVEHFVAGVTLTPWDIGPGGFVLMFALQRTRFTRPNLRLPRKDGEWVYLFNLLTTGTEDLVARNNRLFAEARSLGGVRYPIGSNDFTQADWQAHYGERWPQVLADKQEFDPDNIMTPGLGIF